MKTEFKPACSRNESSRASHDITDIPRAPLIVLEGKLNGNKVQILKDDGCNTNVISKDCVNKFNNKVSIIARAVYVRHSHNGTCESAIQVSLDSKVKIGQHVYRANWVVEEGRYDFLLGMPWHVSVEPVVHYTKRGVTVSDEELTIAVIPTNEDDISNAEIANTIVQAFRKFLSK